MIKRLLILLLLAAPLQGATYYVSTSGSDSNSGLTELLAWKTLNKISITNFATSDTILFKRGNTFYGEFSKPLWVAGFNGTAANYFYFGAYGEGDKPVIVMDCSNLVWTKRAGYDSIYVAPAIGFCYSSYGYEHVGADWVMMTQYSSDISDLGTPDSLIDYLNSMVSSSFLGAHRDMPFDSVYCRTHDGLEPDIKILRQNFFKGDYITMENIEFRNGFHAINTYPVTNSIFRSLRMKSFLGITFFLAGGSSNNLIEYCRADSGAYTAFYSWYSHQNLFQYDTAYVVCDTVMGGIVSNIEQAGFGAERDTACVWQYCYVYGAEMAGWDTFFNFNDTIRYCKVEGSGKGYMLQGVGWVAHNNEYTTNYIYADAAFSVGISYTWGANTYLTTPGQTHVYNNTITVSGSGLYASSCGEGSSILFEGNTVQGTSSTTNLSRLETINTTSINNSFCGLGRWLTGAWPNQVSYYTLAELYAATGYEGGSTYNLVCSEEPENPDIFASSCDAFGNVLIDATSTKTFTLAGEYLTPAADNLTVTGVAGFTISLSEYTGYTSSLSVPYTGGTLAATTIYVKFSPNEEKSYSGNLVCSGGGATSENVAVSGNGVTPVQPPEGDDLYLPIIP